MTAPSPPEILGSPDQPFDVTDDEALQVALTNVRRLLETAPFMVVNIHPRPDSIGDCPVVYTVGLAKHGFPEIIAGAMVDIDLLAAVVDNVAYEWMDNQRAQIGRFTMASFSNNEDTLLPLETRYIDSEFLADQAPIGLLKAFYGAMPGMAQLLIPHASGVLPCEPEYNQAECFQPLLKELEIPKEKKH